MTHACVLYVTAGRRDNYATLSSLASRSFECFPRDVVKHCTVLAGYHITVPTYVSDDGATFSRPSGPRISLIRRVVRIELTALTSFGFNSHAVPVASAVENVRDT